MDKGEVGEAKHKTQWGQRERHSINVSLACSAKADREKDTQRSSSVRTDAIITTGSKRIRRTDDYS